MYDVTSLSDVMHTSTLYNTHVHSGSSLSKQPIEDVSMIKTEYRHLPLKITNMVNVTNSGPLRGKGNSIKVNALLVSFEWRGCFAMQSAVTHAGNCKSTICFER